MQLKMGQAELSEAENQNFKETLGKLYNEGIIDLQGNIKPKQEFWLFQDGTWSKASMPSSHRDQHKRLEIPNPNY